MTTVPVSGGTTHAGGRNSWAPISGVEDLKLSLMSSVGIPINTPLLSNAAFPGIRSLPALLINEGLIA